jgi:hypothetical protein
MQVGGRNDTGHVGSRLLFDAPFGKMKIGNEVFV